MWQDDDFDTSIEEKVEKLWKWFRVYERGLYEATAADDPLVTELVMRMRDIDQRLVADLGQVIEDKRELVISAGGKKDLFATVMYMADEAPSLKYFRVRAFTPRRPVHVEVVMGDLKLKADDLFFRYQKNNKGYLDITVYPLGGDTADERYLRIVGVMVEALLGEYDAVMKVGELEVISIKMIRDTSDLIPLVRLPQVFDEEVGRD